MAKNFTWRYFTAATFLYFFFSATLTTVNAQCDATTKPTFGFNFNGISVSNINNGSVDPTESATLTLCDGDTYTVSGHFHSSQANRYVINNAVSGGALLFNESDVVNSESVVTAAQLSSTGGQDYTFTLADPGISGTLFQTITPFTDANNNGILDDGDCAGEPIVFTYTISAIVTWYKDVDGDLHASDTRRACSSPGQGWTTTILPVDDCDDGDTQNSGPTFGFNFNGTAAFNINNGSVDPSESVALTICDGETYTTSGHFHSSEANRYVINNAVSGGTLLFDGGVVINSESVVTAAQVSSTAGPHTLGLVDPNVSGTLFQTITPFLDANNNSILDDGDCVGEPIVFTYTITPELTWYKDVDGDLHASETTSSCSSPGQGWTTTVLPLDDCNDNDNQNSAPTFGYNFNGTAVYNINNGSVDPSESASLTLCDGESYTVSGHFHSSEDNLYVINNAVSGGGLLFNGGAVINSESVVTTFELSSTAGPHALSLADPGLSGTLFQTITPFLDANNNRIPDAGDCVGEPIVFTYTITPGLIWYKDVDGDLHASETTRSCSSPGPGWTTTILPVDDCNDDDTQNSGPTFGYNFNGIAVYNINNGSVDPSESGAPTLCDGESFTTSGHFHSSASNLYVVKNAVSGGGLLLDDAVLLTNSETVITAAQYSATAGTHTFNLIDPDVSGTLVQTVTPFRDINNNSILDAGDCTGEPIMYTYTITPTLTWYKDVDGDLHASETTRSCSSPGQGWTTTILPVDDCDDDNTQNSGPTFGFNFNGTAAFNINNGSVDPSESVALTICDGETYTTSGHFHSSEANLYVINNAVSGGGLLYEGRLVINSESVVTAGQIYYTAGSHTLSLVNPAVGGVLIQKITPFTDLNHNQVLDAGDCVGDPILFTYTVTTGSKTWYKDADGDGYGGQSCHVRACVKPAGYVSCNTDCDDNNKLVHEPITYYRDADGDGYGDPNSSISVCESNAPAGYVKNNYDWNDQNKAGKSCDERITMCLNGNTEIVYVQYMDKKLSQGWKPGPCSNSTIKVTKGANDKPEKTARNTADQTIPEEYSLSNSPNPFKGTSTLKYALPVDSKVLIVVYDITGRNLGTLVNGDKKAGNYSVNFNARGLSSGIYYYRIAAKSSDGNFDQTNKMVLAR